MLSHFALASALALSLAAGYAAAARWALESWRAAAHDPDTLSVPYLTNAYDLTRPDACSATRRTAMGPHLNRQPRTSPHRLLVAHPI